MSEITYTVRRFYANDENPSDKSVIMTGLTLEEAAAWCQDHKTQGTDENGDMWFDGYERETP